MKIREEVAEAYSCSATSLLIYAEKELEDTPNGGQYRMALMYCYFLSDPCTFFAGIGFFNDLSAGLPSLW